MSAGEGQKVDNIIIRSEIKINVISNICHELDSGAGINTQTSPLRLIKTHHKGTLASFVIRVWLYGTI